MKLIRPAKKDFSNPWKPAGAPVTRATHRGLDFGWGSGDEITAAAPGKVVAVYNGGGYNGGWGNRVVIDHGNGIFTSYNHMATNTIQVRVGQQVGAGAFLGRMGATGETGKPPAKHLHFELMLGGSGPANRVDPAPYFGIDLPGTATPAAVPGGQRTVRRDLTSPIMGRLNPTLSGEVRQRLAPGVLGNFDGFIRGQQVDQNGHKTEVWFRGAFNGNYFWAGNFQETMNGLGVAGLADLGTFGGASPAPVPLTQFVRLDTGWFFYNQLANALAGNYAKSQMLGAGDYRVLEVNPAGPIRVDSPKGMVWLGTKNTRPPVVWK
ncbi:M23 family metallopeptidase [Microbacterium lacus]|uniref:M23 family metallopeptidase n=1 Tax=Microbacterium lacus TaxID=415217 RepID=UPI000C2C65F6|nr:M23 family metallopeptidase [Microbacterium lacus]